MTDHKAGCDCLPCRAEWSRLKQSNQESMRVIQGRLASSAMQVFPCPVCGARWNLDNLGEDCKNHIAFAYYCKLEYDAERKEIIALKIKAQLAAVAAFGNKAPLPPST